MTEGKAFHLSAVLTHTTGTCIVEPNKHSLLVHCIISECLFVSTRIETN